MSDHDQHLEALTDELLDMWQDNIRRHAVDHELLTPADMLALLDQVGAAETPP